MSPRRVAALLAVAALLIIAACGPKHAKNPFPPVHGPTTTLVPRPPGFVALGDSYTSGGGSPPYDVNAQCAVSTKSWPNQVAALVPTLDFQGNKACGGATTVQFLEPWPARHQPAQIPAKPDPDVGLVVFTIGGNDVKLATVILACATLDCSGTASSKTARANLANLTTTLVDTIYPALHRAYPKARLVHMGYPYGISEELGKACTWLSPEEVDEPNDLDKVVNAAIKRATQQSGLVDYLDVTHAFKGHEMCTSDPWINDITQGSSGLHPNPFGYAALAKAVVKGLDL